MQAQNNSAISFDTEGVPGIILGGKRWLIPMLSARQNRIIDPIILNLLPLFSEWQADKMSALGNLGKDHYAALQEMAFHAIKRSAPELTFDAFLEWPVTLPELIAAFPIIAQQTGIFSRDDPGESSAGEAGAGNALTGTPSSPMSAT